MIDRPSIHRSDSWSNLSTKVSTLHKDCQKIRTSGAARRKSLYLSMEGWSDLESIVFDDSAFDDDMLLLMMLEDQSNDENRTTSVKLFE